MDEITDLREERKHTRSVKNNPMNSRFTSPYEARATPNTKNVIQ